MRQIFCGLLVILSSILHAQYDHEGVFPDLDGDALRNALIDEFKTSTVLTYSQARDTFFRNIDAVDNVLECVYTGFKITLDPNLDPTTDAFAKGINTEHTFPRSKGAFENTDAFSDMHHLFPTREGVNADRGSLPFMEINDVLTDSWYRNDQVTSSIPSQNIDEYSELDENVAFEPREIHKGDVARAYFYFYTMYKNQADQADSDFFESQREDMCDWHFSDPVDEKEWIRNEKISAYQGGKKNPFILDCRLARLYCDAIIGSCLMVSTKDLKSSDLSISPNPANETIYINSEQKQGFNYIISSAHGLEVLNGKLNKLDTHYPIAIDDLNPGFYFIKLYDENGIIVGVAKFIKI